MKNLTYLLIILLISCCPKNNISTYKKQIETCKEEKSNLKSQVDELKLENIALMDSTNILHKELNMLYNNLNLCNEMLSYNLKICDSIKDKLSFKINSLQNALDYCNQVYNEDLVMLKKCEDENKLFAERIGELLTEIGQLKTGIENYQIVNEKLTDSIIQTTENIVQLKEDNAYQAESIEYLSKKLNIDYGSSFLLIKTDSSLVNDSAIIDISLKDKLYRRAIIDSDSTIVYLYKSESEINTIELELTNNVRTIIDKIELNKDMVSVQVIPPAYIRDTKIIMEEIGSKIIINK